MARILTASELESGESPHTQLAGGLGDGTGKWRLSVSADRPIQVMSLLELPTGHLTNLSRGQDGVGVPPPPPPNQPDLIVEAPSANPTTPSAGQLILLSATVRNQGGAQAAATRLRFYRSSDPTISRADTPLQDASVNALPPSGTSSSAISVTAPSAAGTYYYGACVDEVSGESNTANNCSSAVRVTVSGSGGNYWGAIASGFVGNTCGYGWASTQNYTDRNAAISDAEAGCRSLGLSQCSRDVVFDRCGALAYGRSATRCGLYGDLGATRAEAEANTLAECRAGFSNCQISVSTTGQRASYCNIGAGAPAEAQSGSQTADSPFQSGDSASSPNQRP